MHRLTMARIEGDRRTRNFFKSPFVSVCCHSTNMLSKHGFRLARPTSLQQPYLTSSSESMFGFSWCTDGSEMGGWCTKRIERYGGGDWSGHKNKSTWVRGKSKPVWGAHQWASVRGRGVDLGMLLGISRGRTGPTKGIEPAGVRISMGTKSWVLGTGSCR